MRKKYFYILTCEVRLLGSSKKWKRTESGEFFPRDSELPEDNQSAIYAFLFNQFKKNEECLGKTFSFATVFYRLTETT